MKIEHGMNAIVTGASRGIGPYIAKTLAARGVNVALAARSAEKLEETRAACLALGVRAITIPTDIRLMDDLQRLAETSNRELGAIDILVNNAGVEVTSSVLDHSFEQVDDIICTNLNAPIWLTKLLLPGMLQRRRGAIVNVSSMAGKAGAPYNAIYSATKFGLNGFTQSLAMELDGSGVTAGVVCPAFVGEAGMWANSGRKAPRMMREVSPQKVADAVLKVIAGASEALVTPGPIRPLLAAADLFPGLTMFATKRMGIVEAMRSRTEAAPEPEPVAPE
jgi:short-subunit dehydrogenase